MSTYLLIILAVGASVILILLLAVIVAIKRGRQNPGETKHSLSPRDEQKMMAYMDDGIGEIFGGLIIAMFGFYLLSEMVWMAGVFVAIFTPLYISSKRSYTAPRLHLIDDQRPRKGGFTGLMMVLLLLGVLSLVIGSLLFGMWQVENVAPLVSGVLSNYGWALAGVFAAAIWCVLGYFSETPRFYFYGLLFLLVIGLGMRIGFELPLLVGAMGGFVLAVGFALLYKFTHQYPLASGS